jgi:hypothetical protein
MSVHSRLLAEWCNARGERLVFNPDSSLYNGSIDTSYLLESSGSTQNINRISFYNRVSGDDFASIVGHWRDQQNGEEMYF